MAFFFSVGLQLPPAYVIKLVINSSFAKSMCILCALFKSIQTIVSIFCLLHCRKMGYIANLKMLSTMFESSKILKQFFSEQARLGSSNSNISCNSQQPGPAVPAQVAEQSCMLMHRTTARTHRGSAHSAPNDFAMQESDAFQFNMELHFITKIKD